MDILDQFFLDKGLQVCYKSLGQLVCPCHLKFQSFYFYFIDLNFSYWLQIYKYYQIVNLIANNLCNENYAVFKLTAEGPLGPSSTSKVKA